MKANLGILLLILISKGTIQGQKFESDTLGYYCKGVAKWSPEHFNENPKDSKILQGKTYMIQDKYGDGGLYREFFRDNDSIFVYAEHYPSQDNKQPKAQTTNIIKRQGFAIISKRTTRDTVIMFDPETFKEIIYLDTLLLPIGKWTFYHENGNKKSEGFFLNGQKHQLWKHYNKRNQPTLEIIYNNGTAEKTTFINRLEEKSPDIIYNLLLNKTWLSFESAEDKDGPLSKTLQEMKELNYSDYGLGSFFKFAEKGILEYHKTTKPAYPFTKSEDQPTIANSENSEGVEYSEPDMKSIRLVGTWKLLNYHQLEIKLGGQIEVYDLSYAVERWLSIERMAR